VLECQLFEHSALIYCQSVCDSCDCVFRKWWIRNVDPERNHYGTSMSSLLSRRYSCDTLIGIRAIAGHARFSS